MHHYTGKTPFIGKLRLLPKDLPSTPPAPESSAGEPSFGCFCLSHCDDFLVSPCLRDAQIAGQTLILGMSVRVFLEEISV